MSLLTTIWNNLTLNGKGDNHGVSNFGCSLGVVMDADDPLQMGRLRIYCPELNDDPKKPQHLPWALYVTPFGGSIRNNSYTRGHINEHATSTGTTQYGFWAIPEVGANVLVTCIGGDSRKRIWMGCLYEHGEVGGLFNGVYDWNGTDGEPDGPFCSPGPSTETHKDYEKERFPLEPLYTNQGKAFNNDRKSREWKTRAADYTGNTNVDLGKNGSGTNTKLMEAETDEWVKEKLGAMGYDWSSFKNLGAYLSAKLFGFMTPGLHTISMDDRPFNSRIRIRTTAGHQIILDDTNERIYVSTYEGKSWVELDKSGNIDIFGEKRFSVHAKQDINFSTDETFRVKAKKGIYMYSGDSTGQGPLTSIPEEGEIRFHATKDIHMRTEQSYRHYSKLDTKFEIDGTYHTIVEKDMFLHTLLGTYFKSETETYIKTPTNVISLTDIGITSGTDFNVVINAGAEIVMAANLGPIISGGGLFAGPFTVPVQSESDNINSIFGGTTPYGIDLGDIGCEIPVNGPLFKLDIFGNINLQSMVDTFIKGKVDMFSTGIQKMNDNMDELTDKYNAAMVLFQEEFAIAIQAFGIIKNASSFPDLFNIPIPTMPSLDGLLSTVIADLKGKFHLPNLGLPDLCGPTNPIQITFAYDIASELDLPPLQLSAPDESGLKFGIEIDELDALPSGIKFAPWTNRVPEHEPWPRVMKIDIGDTINTKNDRPQYNVDWVDQFNDDGSEEGSKPIGVTEGDEIIERGVFWRR